MCHLSGAEIGKGTKDSNIGGRPRNGVRTRGTKMLGAEIEKAIEGIGAVEVALETRAKELEESFKASRERCRKERKRAGEKSHYSALNLRIRHRRGKLEVEWSQVHAKKLPNGKRRWCRVYIATLKTGHYDIRDLTKWCPVFEHSYVRATEKAAREIRDAWENLAAARRELVKMARREENRTGDYARYLRAEEERE